mmetsp:Transcript_612/g.1285  ORF Transcript_612/g.1285 Transcript_612/m.1285 type:complete len:380 (-) Transcript_612:447-1586(-)
MQVSPSHCSRKSSTASLEMDTNGGPLEQSIRGVCISSPDILEAQRSDQPNEFEMSVKVVDTESDSSSDYPSASGTPAQGPPDQPPQSMGTEDNIPAPFICPIGGDVMADPVMCADGHSYERELIKRWFSSSQSCASPVAGAPLSSRTLTPNHALRNAIDDYMQKFADAEARRQLEERRETYRKDAERQAAAQVGTPRQSSSTGERDYGTLTDMLRSALLVDFVAWSVVLGASLRWVMAATTWVWALATAWALVILYAVIAVCRKASRSGQMRMRDVLLDAAIFSIGMSLVVFGALGLFLEFQERFTFMFENPTFWSCATTPYSIGGFAAMVLLTLARIRAFNSTFPDPRVLLWPYGLLVAALCFQMLVLSLLLQLRAFS